MARLPLFVLSVSFVGLVGCLGGGKLAGDCEEGTHLDGDDCVPDSDADADADADADTDTDIDLSATWPSSFAGSVAYTASVEGNPTCESTVSLAGTKYTGDCSGCDFAFDIEATIDSRSPDNCSLDTFLTWYLDPADMGEGIAVDLHMAHAESYAGYYGSYGNAFLFGYTINYTDYGTAYGPYWSPTVYEGSYYGSFSRTDNEISWNSESTSEDVEYFYLDQDCTLADGVSGEESTSAESGTYEATGDLACEDSDGNPAGTVDVYSVTLVTDGQLSITLDTVAADTAFDPWFIVNDAAGCSIFGADDSFVCTFPPPEYECPSGVLDAVAGTYQIIVQNYGSCAGDSGAYKLTVGADADPTLTLDLEDVTSYELTEVTYTAVGSGTITD